MYGGDFSRKKNLVDHGFRLPSAYDNRPLRIDEFQDLVPRMLYVSATPGERSSVTLLRRPVRKFPESSFTLEEEGDLISQTSTRKLLLLLWNKQSQKLTVLSEWKSDLQDY